MSNARDSLLMDNTIGCRTKCSRGEETTGEPARPDFSANEPEQPSMTAQADAKCKWKATQCGTEYGGKESDAGQADEQLSNMNGE